MFLKLLGLHSCHYCSGFIRLWAPASSNFNPNFNAHLWSDSFETRHVYTLHTTNPTAKIWAQLLNNWWRYYTFSSLSPPSFYLLSLAQFLCNFSQTRHDKLVSYTLLTVQNSRRLHQPIPLNWTFFFSAIIEQTSYHSLDFYPIGPQPCRPLLWITKSISTQFRSNRHTQSSAISNSNFPHYVFRQHYWVF